MVHALAEIWRSLRPSGLLIDIRPFLPFSPVELVSPDRVEIFGRLAEAEYDADDVAADAAIGEITRQGFFRLERADSFHFHKYWSTVAELSDYLEDWTSVAALPRPMARAAERALRRSPPGTRLRLRTYIVVNELRRVDDPAARPFPDPNR